MNYRNRANVLKAAMAVVADDDFDEFDGGGFSGRRDIELAYHEGKTVDGNWSTVREHDDALIAAIRELAAAGTIGDAVVLCPSRRGISEYRRLLDKARIPVLPLENYHGVESDAIKLGSYRRVKGLDFKYVFLPQFNASLKAAFDLGEQVAEEYQELARRQLYVAITRARETVWRGTVGPG